MQKVLLYAAAALLVAQPVLAAENPWLGTWKLNQSKSSLTGSTTKVVQNGKTYHFDFGAVKYDVIEDGQDHPTIPDHTSMLKPTGKNEWLMVNKVKGVEVSRSKLTLSDDGKSLTQSITGTQADGKTYSSENKMVRVDASSGLAGTWKDTAVKSSANEVFVCSDAGNGKMKVVWPQSKNEVVAGLDGAPAAVQGPRLPPGETWSFHRVSPVELKYAIAIQGKPFVEGVETVSADGKVLKDVSWLVSQPTEKTTEIFEKQ